jgi:Tol biopolymer transport system component/DNA-binding winged helix-turn-helix (wHTH) protein
MNRAEEQRYQFGPFQMDGPERRLWLNGHPVALEPKAFDVLLLLVSRDGRLVEKDEIMRAVWPNTFVEESNLTRNISLLRKVLAEGFSEQCIETVPKHGYRFSAPVRVPHIHDETELIAEKHTITRIVTEEEEDREEQTGRKGDGETRRSATAHAKGNLHNQLTKMSTSRGLKTYAVAAAVGALLIAVAAFGVWQFFKPRASANEKGQVFEAMHVGRFTSSGNIVSAAISPDGKYVATVLDEGGQQSLWVRQVASNTSAIRLVAPALVEYWGLTFSNDSNFVYYVSWVRNESGGSIYQLPVLGGSPRRLPTLIDTPISFSPDGAHFTYVFSASSKGESFVKVADVDGGGAQTLIERRLPEFVATYPGGSAWSPDGKTIAYAAGAAGQDADRRMRVFVADTAAKFERPLSIQSWRGIGRVVWLGDGSGVVISAMDEMDAPRQLWFVSYPDGAAHRITNDLHDYESISLTADAKTIAAVQTQETFLISFALLNHDDPNSSELSSGRELLSEVGSTREGLAWTPDNRVVYSSRASGNYDIWSAGIDGGDKRQLTFDSHNDLFPSVSADGRYIFFASDRAGTFNIWRTDIDGSNALQLTHGRNQTLPAVSPDGQWVFYQQGITNDEPNVWRVPATGGEPERMTNPLSYRPVSSPDGKLLAYVYLDEKEWGIGVRPLSGDATNKKFPFPSTVGSRVFRWAPDGQSLAYIANKKGVSNIWLQPLNGQPPRQFTNFRAGQLRSFAWSQDGQQLALMRHQATSDVILLSNFK